MPPPRLIDTLTALAAELGVPILFDLGYENTGDCFRHPAMKPAGAELTEVQQA